MSDQATPEQPKPQPPLEKRVLILKPDQFGGSLLPRRQRIAQLLNQGRIHTDPDFLALKAEVEIIRARAKVLEADTTAPTLDIVRQRQKAIGIEFARLDQTRNYDYFLREGLQVRLKLLAKRAEELRKQQILPENKTNSFIAHGETLGSRKHPRNEDSFLVDLSRNIAVVCDGSTGTPNAHKASKLSAETIVEYLSNPPIRSFEDANKRMADAFLQAHRSVYEKVPGGGTTATAIYLYDLNGKRHLVVGHIGDSRAYLRNKDGSVKCLTEDFGILRQDYLAGKITAEEYSSLQNELNKAKKIEDLSSKGQYYFKKRIYVLEMIGGKPFTPNVRSFEVNEGDTLILTSDGVHDNLTIDDISTIIESYPDPNKSAKALVRNAFDISQQSLGNNIRSKEDDMSAVVLKIPTYV